MQMSIRDYMESAMTERTWRPNIAVHELNVISLSSAQFNWRYWSPVGRYFPVGDPSHRSVWLNWRKTAPKRFEEKRRRLLICQQKVLIIGICTEIHNSQCFAFCVCTGIFFSSRVIWVVSKTPWFFVFGFCLVYTESVLILAIIVSNTPVNLRNAVKDAERSCGSRYLAALQPFSRPACF